MYHREHANLAQRYDPYSNMSRRTLHPFSKTICSQSLSRSPTLSYELPYALQPPPPSNIRQKSVTATHGFYEQNNGVYTRFMSKITEELAASSPSPSPLPTPETMQKTKTKKSKKSENKQKRICAAKGIQKTRHFSDDIDYNQRDIDLQLDKMHASKPKMVNSTSNRSYRKYKTRINKTNTCKQNGERKHHTSEGHENIMQMQQNKHRNTEKKTHAKRSKACKTRKKNRAQSTVLYSENNHNRNQNYTPSYKVIIDDDDCRCSQDSYAQKIKTKKNKNNRPQTARTQRKKHKTKNKDRPDDKKHYKSQSHGLQHTKYHRQKPTKPPKAKKRVKTHKTTKRQLNFNEGAMDYMSAEQQLLYLYDYTSAAVMDRSSGSLSINDDEEGNSSTATAYTPKTCTNTLTTPYTVSVNISNCRNGVNSDAITPRSRTCSSPIINCNVLSPPLSKYSQLSTRAVRYTPAARHKRARTEVITPEHSLPNLPSPHGIDLEHELFQRNPFQHRHHSSYESTMIIHHDDDPSLLEIPASLTAEEEGACYLEGEGTDNDEISFPTSPLMYRLLINDKEWQDVCGILRHSKLQCTV